MKELEKWDNNPRMMWVWDNNDMSDLRKAFVVFLYPHSERGYANVLTVHRHEDADAYGSCWYGHCAEIEPLDLMTNRQLAAWLHYKSGREYISFDDTVRSSLFYNKGSENDKCADYIRVREPHETVWKFPTVELLKEDI